MPDGGFEMQVHFLSGGKPAVLQFASMHGSCLVLKEENRQKLAKAARAKEGRGPAFGIYKGEAHGIEVGIQNRPDGTGLVVVNKTAAPLVIDPTKVKVVTAGSSVSPCTFHMIDLLGIGSPFQSVTVGAGQRAGYMLGACPGRLTDGALSGPFVVGEQIKRVQLGGLDIPVRSRP
jgi:hypothetical protein